MHYFQIFNVMGANFLKNIIITLVYGSDERTNALSEDTTELRDARFGFESGLWLFIAE